MGQNKGKREPYYLLTSAATHPLNKKARKKTEQTYAVIVAVAFGVAKEEGEEAKWTGVDRVERRLLGRRDDPKLNSKVGPTCQRWSGWKTDRTSARRRCPI